MVKVGKSGVTVGPNSVQNVKCVVRSKCLQGGRLVIFEPCCNLLAGVQVKEILVKIPKGSTCRVSVPIVNDTPSKLTLCHGHVFVTLRDFDYPKQMSKTVEQETLQVDSESMYSSMELWDTDISLDNRLLSQDQIKQIRQMFREECTSFSKDDDDIGDAPNLQLDIELLDREPVRKTYSSIPPSLYKEVKDYVTDLVNRGWTKKSKSPYTSPMVCVRKKDMSLRLYIDYRDMNQKSVQTRQLIPRIQDSLDRLKEIMNGSPPSNKL